MKNIENLLLAEYHYAAQTAHQAHEDRSKATAFFVSGVIALVLTPMASDSMSRNANSTGVIILVLTILMIFGLITLLKLARLRVAWVESARAMNHIKQYILELDKHTVPDCLKETSPFRWSQHSMPKPLAPLCISSLLACQVSLLNGSLLLVLLSSIFSSLSFYLSLSSGLTFTFINFITYAMAVSSPIASQRNSKTEKKEVKDLVRIKEATVAV